MIHREHQRTIQKLRRRITFLIIILFSLIYWNITKYHDHQFTVEENNILSYELIQLEAERDSLIQVLSKPSKTVKVEPIVKKSTKKTSVQLIDTLKNVPNVTEFPLVTQDTLQP
jgi:hypothetical protein